MASTMRVCQTTLLVYRSTNQNENKTILFPLMKCLMATPFGGHDVLSVSSAWLCLPRVNDRCATRHDTTRHDTTRHDTTRHDTTPHDVFITYILWIKDITLAVSSSSSSFIHNIYKQIHIKDKFAQYNTFIAK